MAEKASQDAIRAARNAYQREWARKNKDKVRAAQERYWTKRAEQIAAAEASVSNGGEEDHGEHDKN